MVEQSVPNIARMSSIYESDPPPSSKMSTNTNQIRPIFQAGTKDESDVSNVGLGHELRIRMLGLFRAKD
jgi:hypothetical protein